MQQLFSLPLILLSVAFFSLFERKLMGLIQSRKGPNKVWQGLGQPIADALKLISKPEVVPGGSIKTIFYLTPVFLFICSASFWAFMPMVWGGSNSMWSWGMVLVLFSVSVYGLIFAGWFSNSKFAGLGAIRSVTQSLSYEVGLALNISLLLVLFSSMGSKASAPFVQDVTFFLALFPIAILLFIVLLAELNRSPFDLSEGESELVSGFNVEYGGLSYTLIFLGENLAILWASGMMGVLFNPFSIPIIVWWFVWVRASEPRIRYDKLMVIFWQLLLPVLLSSWSVLMGWF